MANDDLKPELREQIQKGGGEHSLFPRIMLSLLESAEKAEADRAELAGQVAEREQTAGKQTVEVLESIQKSNQEAAERAEAGRAELAGQTAEREQSAGKQNAEVLEAIQRSNQEAAERHAKTQKTVVLFGVLSLVAILAAAAAFFFVQK